MKSKHIRKHWLIFPGDETIVERYTYNHSYIHEGKKRNIKGSYARLRRPIDTNQFKKHKANIVSLVEELMKKEGTLSTFHFHADDSCMEHGFHGWGFTVKRSSGLYELVSGYSKGWGGKYVHKGAVGRLDLSYRGNPPKYLPDEKVSELLKDGHHKSFHHSLKLSLKDIDISLFILGAAMIYLERDDIEEFIRLGGSEYESALLVNLGLKGFKEDVNKYLKLFKERLGTVFIKDKTANEKKIWSM